MDVALVYRHDNFSRNDFALKVDALCDMDARTFFCSIFALQVFEQASKTCNAKTRIPLMLFCVTSVVNFPGKDFSLTLFPSICVTRISSHPSGEMVGHLRISMSH